MKLTIKQSNTPEIVTSEVIDGLYSLSSGGNLTNDSELEGNLQTTAAYEDSVTYLTSHFPRLTINAASYYIRFADPAVEEVLRLSMGKDESEGITVQEAAVANLGTIFRNNTQIETFDELPYFTSPNYGIGAYQNCTNLRRVDVSNSGFPKNIFDGCTNLEYFHGPNSVQGELRIKDGVTKIDDRALEHTKVRSVIFPDSVRTITNSFFECSSLQSVTFGTGPLDIKLNAFYQCTHLQEVHVPSLADWEDITFASDNGTANPLAYAHHLYVNGQEVTSITYPSGTTTLKAMTFAGGSSMTSVTIPSTVTSIGKDHFTVCSGLQRVDITDLDAWIDIVFSSATSNPLYYAPSLYVNGNLVTSVDFTGKTEIKKFIFGWYQGLTSVVLPSTITKIDMSAFARCKNLVISDLSLPNLTYIGAYAFGTATNGEGCKITTISNLGSITTIPEYCFANSPTLSSVTIPNTVTSIGKYAFQGCSGLISVIIPESVTSIGDWAFHNCRNLTTIDLTNITTLGDEAFGVCSSLSRFNGPNSTVGEIFLPNLTGNMKGAFKNLSQFETAQIIYNITSLGTITEIGQWCFSIMRIETIHLPSTLKIVGANAFMNCPYVHDIYWEGTMDQWVNIDFRGDGANPCSRSSVNFYVNGTIPTSYTFSSGTTTIKQFVFDGVKVISSINIPNSVTSIGVCAFRGCVSLGSVDIPNSVTTLSQSAFSKCSGLTSVTLGNSVTSIGNYAFYGTESLRSLTIYAVIPPTAGTQILNGAINVTIYVPAASVDAYKTASGWSTYASRIQAIPTT